MIVLKFILLHIWAHSIATIKSNLREPLGEIGVFVAWFDSIFHQKITQIKLKKYMWFGYV